MPMTIAVETERGETVKRFFDVRNHLRRMMERASTDEFRVLRYIDWYGDTLINQVQMEDFIHELRVFSKHAENAGESGVIDALLGFARECEGQRLYIKFYGD